MKLGPSGIVSKGWRGPSPTRFDGLLMLGVGLSQYFAGLSCRNDIQQINGAPELMWGCCIIPPSSIKMTTQQLPLNLCHSPSADQSPRLPTFSPCFSLSLLLLESLWHLLNIVIFLSPLREQLSGGERRACEGFWGLSFPADNLQKLRAGARMNSCEIAQQASLLTSNRKIKRLLLFLSPLSFPCPFSLPSDKS